MSKEKSFTNVDTPETLTAATSPALGMMQEADNKAAAPKKKENRRNKKPAGVEAKSQRVNLLLRPSLYEDAKKVAAMKRTSVNDMVNDILQSIVNDNKGLIKKYNDFFGM